MIFHQGWWDLSNSGGFPHASLGNFMLPQKTENILVRFMHLYFIYMGIHGNHNIISTHFMGIN